MSELVHVPLAMAKEALADMLELIAVKVRDGDSHEGTISWEIPSDMARIDAGDIDVRAVFRTGNLLGQGSVTMVGELVPREDIEEEGEEP